MKEIWRDIEGYEGYYQVSNLGNVKALARKIKKSNGVVQPRKEKLKAKKVSTDGYHCVTLSKNGKDKTVAIHILVAKAFIPNIDNLPEINHKDCDRTNNNVDNLEWCTHQQNVEHSVKLGHYKHYGADNPNYKNDTLKLRYQNNSELRKRLARKGEQNGMCKPIRIHFAHNRGYKDFKFIGEAAMYLQAINFSDGDINTIRSNITQSIKKNSEYLCCRFERL